MSIRRAYATLAEQRIDGIDVEKDASLARCTTYRIGGPTSLLVTAHSYEALSRALRVLRAEDVPWVVLGRGSNVLASDEGYNGCVLRLGRGFARMQVDEALVTAGAALMLPKLVNETLTRGLSGLECCAGIPGTVGGALAMDAGSRHEWIGRCVRDVVCLDPERGLVRHFGSDIEWGYRHTSLPASQIILEATFELTPSTREAVSAEMNRRTIRRRVSQPVGKACCGSVFRNPPDRSVGKMLEDCGLKGRREGQACVSDVHANFVINEGGAKARDVIALMGSMHDAVLERFGVDLVPEVKLLGFNR